MNNERAGCFSFILVENVAQFIFVSIFLVRGIMDKIGFEGSYFYGCKRRKMLIDLTSAKGIAGNEDEVRSLFKSMQHRMRINFYMMALAVLLQKCW